MTSSQWHFPPKVEVCGELTSKKSLSSKICKQGTAFLLTAHYLALPSVQSLNSLNVLVTWIPRPLAVDLMMASDEWPNSTWRSLTLLSSGAVADTALLLLESHRKSTSATQPSWVLIRWSSTMSLLGVLITMLFNWSLEILFPLKSLHVKENRFAPAMGQNLTGHRVWTCSALLTCHTITSSLSFFVAGIIPELPWIDSSMPMTS